ncbi:MAG: DUF2934 domain-containing protein [Opitutaceae bacterium]|nr:DUF2934 domain-containing protein [Opitutaceae bacterium]
MRKPAPHPHETPEPSEAEIQKAAYHLWIEGGRLEGVELDNWLAAKELLRHHHGVAHPSKKKPAAAPGRAAQA